MGTLKYDPVNNPMVGMVINYTYQDLRGVITVNAIKEERTGIKRIFFIDQMDGGDEETNSMYLDHGWEIFLTRVVRVNFVFVINKDPEWEV